MVRLWHTRTVVSENLKDHVSYRIPSRGCRNRQTSPSEIKLITTPWAFDRYDRIAQCTLAVSALTTATGFLAYGVLTLSFYNTLDADYRNSVRAEQVVDWK